MKICRWNRLTSLPIETAKLPVNSPISGGRVFISFKVNSRLVKLVKFLSEIGQLTKITSIGR
jgi:hypothetical protein